MTTATTCTALPLTTYAYGYSFSLAARCIRQLRVLHRCEVSR